MLSSVEASMDYNQNLRLSLTAPSTELRMLHFFGFTKQIKLDAFALEITWRDQTLRIRFGCR